MGKWHRTNCFEMANHRDSLKSRPYIGTFDLAVFRVIFLSFGALPFFPTQTVYTNSSHKQSTQTVHTNSPLLGILKFKIKNKNKKSLKSNIAAVGKLKLKMKTIEMANRRAKLLLQICFCQTFIDVPLQRCTQMFLRDIMKFKIKNLTLKFNSVSNRKIKNANILEMVNPTVKWTEICIRGY